MTFALEGITLLILDQDGAALRAVFMTMVRS
jgi:hypothetical protein